jgi:hypothetical protein
MEFQKPSQEDVLADLTSRLRDLPPKHPDRPKLARLIVALRAELSAPKPRHHSVDASGTDYADKDKEAQLVAEARQRWRLWHHVRG